MSRADALKVERQGYVRRGLTDRIAQVDAELAALGLAPEAAVAHPAERAIAPKPARPAKPKG